MPLHTTKLRFRVLRGFSGTSP